MFALDGWDLAVVGVAGYVALSALVRLMSTRRDDMIDELSRHVALERQRQRARKQKEARKRRRAEMRQRRRPAA